MNLFILLLHSLATVSVSNNAQVKRCESALAESCLGAGAPREGNRDHGKRRQNDRRSWSEWRLELGPQSGVGRKKRMADLPHHIGLGSRRQIRMTTTWHPDGVGTGWIVSHMGSRRMEDSPKGCN